MSESTTIYNDGAPYWQVVPDTCIVARADSEPGTGAAIERPQRQLRSLLIKLA